MTSFFRKPITKASDGIAFRLEDQMGAERGDFKTAADIFWFTIKYMLFHSSKPVICIHKFGLFVPSFSSVKASIIWKIRFYKKEIDPEKKKIIKKEIYNFLSLRRHIYNMGYAGRIYNANKFLSNNGKGSRRSELETRLFVAFSNYVKSIQDGIKGVHAAQLLREKQRLQSE